jgi:hypothetical protein
VRIFFLRFAESDFAEADGQMSGLYAYVHVSHGSHALHVVVKENHGNSLEY